MELDHEGMETVVVEQDFHFCGANPFGEEERQLSLRKDGLSDVLVNGRVGRQERRQCDFDYHDTNIEAGSDHLR